MKRTIKLFVALALLFFAAACTVKSKAPAKTSVGDAYDVLVVCDDEAWRGELSMAVCDLLEEDAAGLTRPEGYFDIVKQVSHKAITDYERKYANIFIINTDIIGEPSLSVVSNRYSHPQTIVVLNAANREQATAFIRSSMEDIRELFNAAERTRSNRYYEPRSAEQLIEDFKSETGFEMLIPQGFFKATTRDKELLWYLRDYDNKAQYIFAYSYPCENKEEDLTAEWIMRSLDNKLSTITSKGAVGSYMGVNESGPAYLRSVDIAGRNWKELRGWWEVNNDFMGGPFVSFSTYDEASNEITTIMFALYAPEDRQRNLLRELENLIYTIE